MEENNEIINAINVLRSDDFYGGGDSIEMAKGQYQLTSTWSGFKTKIKRLIKAKR